MYIIFYCSSAHPPIASHPIRWKCKVLTMIWSLAPSLASLLTTLLACSFLVTAAFLLLLKHARPIPTSRPWHWLLPLPGTLFYQIVGWSASFFHLGLCSNITSSGRPSLILQSYGTQILVSLATSLLAFLHSASTIWNFSGLLISLFPVYLPFTGW